MALQYISVPDSDFSRGIDARSAENQVLAGFVKDLLNANTVGRRARKRKGYQGYAGNLPVRVTSVEYEASGTQVCFTLDSDISLDAAVTLDTVRSSPIVVYGRSSVFGPSDGPFNTSGNSVRYYNAFTVPTRKILNAPSGTVTVPASETASATTDLFVQVVESTSTLNRSYSQVYTNAVRIDNSSFSVSTDYNVSSDTPVYIFYKDRTASVGSSYIATLSHTGSGSETFSIPAGTHNLANFDIIPEIQQDLGSEVLLVTPESFLIAPNGDVSVTINAVSSGTFYAILSSSPLANAVSGVIPALSSSTIQITGLTTPWFFTSIYLEQTPGGTKELVLPDSISYDDSTAIATVAFTNGMPVAQSFTVYYEYGNIRSNQLCVTDAAVTIDGSDDKPQLSIWGLDHSEMYVSKENREGWVNHIDAYRNSGEQRLITGLGGNLFSAREYAEAATTYLYPTLYPNLIARSNTPIVLAPLLWETGELPQRTRGYITSTNSGTHWATVTSVQYDSGNGWTKYVLSLPSKAILDSTANPTSLAGVISTTSNLEDFLTVQDMSYGRHNGVFQVKQVLDGTDEITIWADVPNNSTDYDDLNTAGEGGVFTDQINTVTDSPFVSGDQILSDALTNSIVCIVQGSSSTTTVIDGISDILQIPGGVAYAGSRISNVIPLRNTANPSVSSITNLVRGDMLSYTGLDRLLRVRYIYSDITRTAFITSDGTTGTVSITLGDTSYLTVGQSVLLNDAGPYSGTVVITGILSGTSFTFDTTETASSVATLIGLTMEVDEELPWADSVANTNQFRVEERWIPIEAPVATQDQVPNTHIRYFDFGSYTDQSFLRSTMVVSNMYFTNAQDEVYKFDGVSNYRAGLPEWQPGAFLTQETSGANIVLDLRQLPYSAIDATTGQLTITAATTESIPIGTKVRLDGSTQTYTLTKYFDDGTDFYVFMDRSLDSEVSATGDISEIATRRYYFRLNAVDLNSNIIASAVTSSQDYVVEFTEDAAVRLRVIGMPLWDVYDYDRLEVEIYRTASDAPAPFYKITTLPMSFSSGGAYIDFTDAFADSDLTQLDIVSSALKGTELGTDWSQPLRSKYITSIGNSLVLGNVRDYPQLDLQIVGPASLVNADFASDSLLFRRDSTDTATTTNMLSRVRYEWVAAPTGAATAHTIGVDSLSFTTASPTAAVVGDWVYLSYATVATTGRDLSYCGWYQIATAVGTTVTINIPGAVAATSYPDSYTIATDPTDVPVLLGPDGNLGMFNGDSFDTFDTMRRMSLAINASMRAVDTSLTGYESFTPWFIARGGNDLTPAGRLVVRQPRTDTTTMEVVPTFSGYDLFVNSVKRTSLDQISASTRLYPSRILVSYENYPEIFDSPTSILDLDSESAIDVNSADGQEITGVLPFFGEAAFGAAQQSGILVVFKTNSIYLVDINEKRAGRNPVQRIETEGLGCTAPYSIAVTKKGIIFANESGIYCLRRDQAIQYLGEYMERNWTENVDLNRLDLVQGHHYGVGRQYKLSVPITSTESSNGYIENSEVYVYDHTQEDTQQYGSWDRYDNHPSTGWTNLASDAYFSSTNGRVYSIRRVGDVTDFRDDSAPVDFLLDLRANDFGNSGIRKVIDSVTIHYRVGARNTGTQVLYSTDLDTEYQETTAPIIPKSLQNTGIDDPINQSIVSLLHNVQRRKCIYFGLRVTNSTIDEDLEIAGVDFKVGGLNERGTTQASQSRSK